MKRRSVVAGAVTAAVVASGATAAVIGFGSGPQGDAAEPSGPSSTAKVTRATLKDTVTVDGTLGYGDPVSVTAAKQGTYTWLAAVGSTVKRGKPLFKVDEQPVPVLYGKLPLYRTLSSGVEGADVEQLERNLAKLGYQDSAGFTVDEYYGDSTAAAVELWQEDLGLDETGQLKPGDAVVVPSAVRVSEHTAQVGGAAGQGAVLSYTGSTREVVVELEVADQRMAKDGAKVTVAVPGGEEVGGTIAEVATVAAAASEDSSGTPEGENSSGSEDATLEVTVAITDESKLGDLDGGPVDVTFTSSTRKDVLTVPVSALLGLAEGGYGVEVVDAGKTSVVAVETGLFADGRVEISGSGIDEGTVVGVAS